MNAKLYAVVDSDTAVGIDLATRSHEVRKLLYAGFSVRMAREGYDPEDVLQEVYRGILARNQGTCRFDPRKSSFGHYVHMVAACILSNYHRKQSRQRSFEQIGMPSPNGQEQTDAALSVACSSALGEESGAGRHEDSVLHLWSTLTTSLQQHPSTQPLDTQVLPLLAQGYTRPEIAQALHVPLPAVHRSISHIRHVCSKN